MYATPSDNYWLVLDQPDDVRWWSGAGGTPSYVPDSDATYVAWLAAGFETSIITTEQELADLLNATYPAGSPIPADPPISTVGPVSVAVIRDPTATLLARIGDREEIGTLPSIIEGIAEVLPSIASIDVINPLFSAYVGQYVVPAGVGKLLLFGQASGGGGGGCSTAASTVGGAGGPGETRLAILNVEPGDVIDYTIGAPGTGGAAGIVNGSAGADLIIGGAPTPGPVVASSATTEVTVGTASGPINLPAGIVAGNLLLMAIRTSGVPTTPAGWTQIGANNLPGGGGATMSAYYKIATGAEGATVTLVTGAASQRHVVAMRITGHDPATAPSVAGADSTGPGANKTPNPPSLTTPAWGNVKKLWIAAAVAASAEIVGVPSSFTDPIGATLCRTATYVSELATINPTNFTAVSATNWATLTIAIRPVAATGLMVCKGGTQGIGAGGGSIGASGTTPVGSGGQRIPPAAIAWSTASSTIVQSVGGSTMFGVGVNRVAATTITGSGADGPGTGGTGGGNGTSSASARAGGDGAPGMILVIGFGPN